MKRSLFIWAAALCAITAQAADYPYLVFTSTGGTTTKLSVSDMTLVVSGSSLQVTNTDGTTSFTLTDLASMQFSQDGSVATAIENVLDADMPVSVFSLNGASLGTFGNLNETARTLPAGAYVLKQGNNTQTIVLK